MTKDPFIVKSFILNYPRKVVIFFTKRLFFDKLIVNYFDNHNWVWDRGVQS